jgi:hypothetical protein
MAVISFIWMGTGCKTSINLRTKNAPPGQMKKATGSKSAKPFAPGQQKKKKKN